VVNRQGVVGRVISDRESVAKIQLLIDPSSGVAGAFQRTRGQGMVIGMGDRGCRMEYVSELESVEVGDVGSPGTGSDLPQGITIGWSPPRGGGPADQEHPDPPGGGLPAARGGSRPPPERFRRAGAGAPPVERPLARGRGSSRRGGLPVPFWPAISRALARSVDLFTVLVMFYAVTRRRIGVMVMGSAAGWRRIFSPTPSWG